MNKLSDRLSALAECAECNGKGYAEIIEHWERPCDACHGEGYVMTDTQETLREAVARAIAETEGFDPAMDHIEGWYETADAAIASMFERLRTPSEGVIEAGGRSEGVILDDFDGVEIFPKRIWQAMLDKFQQENGDER